MSQDSGHNLDFWDLDPEQAVTGPQIMFTVPSPCKAKRVVWPGKQLLLSWEWCDLLPGLGTPTLIFLLNLGRNTGPLQWSEEGWPRERSKNFKYRAF